MRSDVPRGLTLIELVVVLAILGLLASIAVPGFRGHLVRAGRTEARTALLSLATAQEKFHLQCHAYAGALDGERPSACSPPRLRFPGTTARRAYVIAVTAADASAWTATATVDDGGPQAADGSCRVYQLDSSGARGARDRGGADSTRECWDR